MAHQSWKQQINNNPNFFKEFKLNTNPAHGPTFIPINTSVASKRNTQHRRNIVTDTDEDFSSNMSHGEANQFDCDWSIS